MEKPGCPRKNETKNTPTIQEILEVPPTLQQHYGTHTHIHLFQVRRVFGSIRSPWNDLQIEPQICQGKSLGQTGVGLWENHHSRFSVGFPMDCPSFQQTIFNYNTRGLLTEFGRKRLWSKQQFLEDVPKLRNKSKSENIENPRKSNTRSRVTGGQCCQILLQTNMLGGRNKILTGALREVVSSINPRSLVSN